MDTIYNENGKTYYVISFFENVENSDNLYLLADYGKKTVVEIQAGACPVQYIIARGYSKKFQRWDGGTYLFKRENAIKVYQDKLFDMLYNL